MLTGNDRLPSPADSRRGPVAWPPLDFRPGDLLFFAGRDFESRAIALRTCTWRQLLAAPFSGFLPSHCGVCCDFRGEGLSATLLIESTTFCEEKCILVGEFTKGVQAHFPAARVASYNGKAWRLRLRRPLDSRESGKLTEFLVDQIGKPYNYARAGELATFFARRIPAAPLADTWFCDQLAIEALKVVNRVGPDNDAEQFSPGTFASLLLRSGAVWPIGVNRVRSIRIK